MSCGTVQQQLGRQVLVALAILPKTPDKVQFDLSPPELYVEGASHKLERETQIFNLLSSHVTRPRWSLPRSLQVPKNPRATTVRMTISPASATAAGNGQSPDVGRADAGVTGGWSIHCVKCNYRILDATHVIFLHESERAMHLVIAKPLFVDEQALAPADETREAWSLHTRDDVVPAASFSKTRTTKASKIARCPFELRCISCNAEVGAESHLDGLPGSVMALSQKSCAYMPSSVESQVMMTRFGGPRARKWSLVLKELQDTGATIQVRTFWEYACGESQGGQAEPVETPAVQPLVFATEASIRANFSDAAKMTTLRKYQVELTLSAVLENTIVYLPTGECLLGISITILKWSLV